MSQRTDHMRGHAPRPTTEIRLPRDRSCAALARRFVEGRVGAELGGDALADLKLVVSELVENAYVHGRGEIRLVVAATGERIRVEVVDEGEGAAVKIRE